MRLKSTAWAAALSATLAAPAFAMQEEPVLPLIFSAGDMQQLFEQVAQPMQLAALSEEEMRETEGALLPLLAIAGGAALSAWAYHGISYYRTGQLGTSSGAAWAAGAGALGALHGGGLAAYGGLRGMQAAYAGSRGFGVSSAWNAANPFRPR